MTMNIARCALYKHSTCLAFTSGKRLPSLLNKKLGFITFLLLFSNSENYFFLFLFHNTNKKKGTLKTHRSRKKATTQKKRDLFTNNQTTTLHYWCITSHHFLHWGAHYVGLTWSFPTMQNFDSFQIICLPIPLTCSVSLKARRGNVNMTT